MGEERPSPHDRVCPQDLRPQRQAQPVGRVRLRRRVGVPGPPEYEAMAAIALGQYGERDALPEEIKKNEQPNTRKPLAEVAVKGRLAD